MFIELELMNNKQDYLEYISNFFKSNYTELFSIAKKDCLNTKFEPENILIAFYTWCAKNEAKVRALKQLDGKEKHPLIYWAATWIYNNTQRFKPNKGLSNFQSEEKCSIDIEFNEEQHDSQLDYYSNEVISEKDVWLTNNLSPEDQHRIKIIDDILNTKLVSYPVCTQVIPLVICFEDLW